MLYEVTVTDFLYPNTQLCIAMKKSGCEIHIDCCLNCIKFTSQPKACISKYSLFNLSQQVYPVKSNKLRSPKETAFQQLHDIFAARELPVQFLTPILWNMVFGCLYGTHNPMDSIVDSVPSKFVLSSTEPFGCIN